MPATQVHLVRHGEVFNPDGVLYGRLPNFRLSDAGVSGAAKAAKNLQSAGVQVSKLVVSPLERTRQSAEPISKLFEIDPVIDERIIEPYNFFEGKKVTASSVLLKPNLWFKLRNPMEPSWGEPFAAIASRMNEAIIEAAESVDSGDVVFVTHQLPIWVTHLASKGKPLAHLPNRRRCSTSSITSFKYDSGKLTEIGYTVAA